MRSAIPEFLYIRSRWRLSDFTVSDVITCKIIIIVNKIEEQERKEKKLVGFFSLNFKSVKGERVYSCMADIYSFIFFKQINLHHIYVTSLD